MQNMAFLTIPVTVLTALASVWAVIWSARRVHIEESHPAALTANRGGGYQFTCTLCQKAMAFTQNEIKPLTGIEKGMVVASIPEARRRPLGFHECPHCGADHYFLLGKGLPQWAGSNLYVAQDKQATCIQCLRPLRKPPWPNGAYEGRPGDAPSQAIDFGLHCSRCGAVVCIECARRSTREPAPGGIMVCPRCFRPSLNAYYYF